MSAEDKPMGEEFTPPDFDTLIESMTPDIYERLKLAIELGRWPTGVRLTKAQQESCMQAIIAYDHQHLPEEQRVGFIDRGAKEDGEQCDSSSENTTSTIRFLDS